MKWGADLWNLYVDPLAFGGDVFNINVVIRWVVTLPIPQRVFSRQDPPDHQRDDAADNQTSSNNAPGNVIPRPVFGLPHEWTSRVSNAIGDQENGVCRDPFGMTCSGGGDPGKVEDKSSKTEFECPDRAQKSNLVLPRQKGDEETSQEAGDSTNGDDVTTGVRNPGRELKCRLT